MHCLRSFSTLVYDQVPVLLESSANFIYMLCVLLWWIDASCSKVDNMIILFALGIITASRLIYTIYIPDTLFHTVRTYIRLIYVIAASIRALSSSLERITRRRVSLWRIHMFLFLFLFVFTALHSCYMKIFKDCRTSIKRNHVKSSIYD